MTEKENDSKSGKYVTADDQLAKLRAGNKQKLEINYGDFTIPVRLLSADEFARVISKAKSAVKVPATEDEKVFKSLAATKAILNAAAMVNNVPGFAKGFLDKLTNAELEILNARYFEILQEVDPEYEALDEEVVAALILEARKKELPASNFTTCQLVGIGRYFLDHILPVAKEHGG